MDNHRSRPALVKRKLDNIDQDTNSIVDSKDPSSNLIHLSIFTSIKENVNNRFKKSFNQNAKVLVGLFNLLPDEIFIKILEYLDIKSLTTFSLTNSKIRNFLIENFILSTSGFHHLIHLKQSNNQDIFDQQNDMLTMYASVGLFLKKCTFVFPTNDRIYLLINVLKFSYGIPSIDFLKIFDYNTSKLIFKSYSKIINNFTRGWGDFECFNVFDKLKDLTKMDSFVHKFMKKSLGSSPKEDLFIRHFFRMICSTSLETGNNFKEKVFWITQTLKNYSVEEVSKFFILVFGPLITVNNNLIAPLPYVAWWDLSESQFIETGLEDLGIVFHVLYRNQDESTWNKKYLIQLFQQLINTPSNIWAHANVSTLLYYCGFELTLDFFRKQLKAQKEEVVSIYICYLNIIAYRLSKDVKYVAKIIDILIEEFSSSLMISITNAYSFIIMDTINQTEDDDEVPQLSTFEVVEAFAILWRIQALDKYNIEKFI